MALSLLLPIILPRWNPTQEDIVLEGYQMYAVDNWVLDRQQIPILVVHTGDAAHKITVSALSPPSQTDWDAALAWLRRHANAKPKETPHGTLLVTSLAQFRSDFTIVQIPDGNLESAKPQLYTNINLLRMGCSGRSGLTLEEPSDTTKDRFISTYFLPDNHLSGAGKTSSLFNDTVLELVKLVQVSLHIFGYYQSSSFDGLLCDSTVEGLRLWVKDVGGKLVEGLDSMERTADPSTVASLLSLVLAVRNRLVGLSGSTNIIPKDPFLHPRLFTRALASYVTTNPHSSHSFSPSQITLTSSKGSHASHSPRQSIGHSSHGGSPHIPTSSIPAFLKDQFANLAHGNGSSAEASYSFGHSLPTIPTINSHPISPQNSIISPTQIPSVPSSSRLPGATFSSETLPGMSTPTLSLTVPSPTSGPHTPVMSLSVSNASPINDRGGGFGRAFPSMESSFSDKVPADGVFLTRSLIENVFSVYDAKLLKTNAEVRRAVRKERKANKDRKMDSVSDTRDDDGTGKDALSSIAGLSSVASHSHLLSGSSLPLASGFKAGLTGTLASTLTGGNIHSGAASILMPMSDLEEFIELIIGEISYRRTREAKREKKEKKERDKVKMKEEKEERKERDRREADNLSSSSSSDGIDFTKAAKRVKAKVKGRSDKLRDAKGDERESVEGKEFVKDHRNRKDKDSVGGVGGLVLGLWTGRVDLVIKLREKNKERDRDLERNNQHYDARQAAERDGVLPDGFGSWRSKDIKRPSIWSDGDTDSHINANDYTKTGMRKSLPPRDRQNSPTFARRSSVSGAGFRSRYGSVQSVAIPDKSDGRSTEEEGPGLLGSDTLGALWAKSGSKVKGKLESWAGLSKVDNRSTKSRTKFNPANTALMPHAESNAVNISPTPSPPGSPSVPQFIPGDPPSPIQPFHIPSAFPLASKRASGGKLLIPSSLSPSQSQAHLHSHSPPYGDDDDDLLTSGQVSPIGYGSGYGLGFDSGTDDPRTPKGWPSEYLDNKLIKLGSPFSNVPSKRGSEASAQTHSSSTSSNVQGDKQAAYRYLGTGHPTKRPWPGDRIPHASRVSSWSDPISARDDLQGVTRHSSEASVIDEGLESEDRLSKDEELEREKAMFTDYDQRHRRSSTAKPYRKADVDREYGDRSIEGVAGILEDSHRSRSRSVRLESSGSRFKSKTYNTENDVFGERGTTRKMLGMVPRRRRSFHSLSIYRHDVGAVETEMVDEDVDQRIPIKVLPIDRMRIDVDLCGYYLIMWRRADHLQNVVATLKILTSQLSETNAHMREYYQAHIPDIDKLETQIKIIAEVDVENANALKISQATKTLWYEAEQFRVPDLWHIASPPRQKVLAMREKLFGTGGRRFPQGAHGAHGRFNRLQKTLDGSERLVDSEGKTESEVEEEHKIDEEGVFISPPKEDVEDVVEHPNIKPMWLLRFFTSWVANWRPSASATRQNETSMSPTPPIVDRETSVSSEPVKLEKAASL